jgi:hypothetical protein
MKAPKIATYKPGTVSQTTPGTYRLEVKLKWL